VGFQNGRIRQRSLNTSGRIHKIDCIFGTHVLTKFHEDWTKNVTSRVLTRFYYSHIRKTAPPPGSHVFQQTRTIFKLIRDIVRTNVLTKFHEDWTINVTSRVLTRFYYSHIRKTAPPLGGHVFHPTETIFELVQDFIGTHVPTKFHEDWTKNVTSRVLTRFYLSHIRKTAPPPGSHVFQQTRTIFKLIRDIIRTNILTKFHDYWTKHVTPKVLMRFHYIHIGKTPPTIMAMFFNEPKPVTIKLGLDIIRNKSCVCETQCPLLRFAAAQQLF